MIHILSVAIIGLVLALLGRAMWWLTARAAATPLTEDRPALRALLAALPALAYGAAVLPMLLDMAADPTAANLWPLAVTGLLTLWALYAALLRLALALATAATHRT
jgi:hypothetical protein